MLDLKSSPQRIFIVGNGSLFDEGLAKIVRFSTTLRVSHIVYSNEIELLRLIERKQPDMILLSESGTLDIEQILDAITINTLIIGLCIFVVHLGDYTIDAYERPGIVAERQPFQRRTFTVGAGNDLISILTRPHYGLR
jgi:hypothetical protein